MRSQNRLGFLIQSKTIIFLTKTAAAQNEVTFSYHRVRGLCFVAVIFAEAIKRRNNCYIQRHFQRHKSLIEEVINCATLISYIRITI